MAESRKKKRRAAKADPKSRPGRKRASYKVSPAQRGAVTKARARLERSLRKARSADSASVVEKRSQLRATLERAGYSDASIRGQIGWITRRERERRERAKAAKKPSEILAKGLKGRPPRPELTRQQKAAITRLRSRLEKLPSQPRTLRQIDQRERAHEAFVDLLKRLGFTEKEIRGELAGIRRRRRERDRTLADFQAETLGLFEPLHAGTSRENWNLLREHMVRNSPAFRRYIRQAEELGVDYYEAVDGWFSPEAG